MLVAERICAFAHLRDFTGEAPFDFFGACKALGHRGQFFAARDNTLLQRVEVAAQSRNGHACFGGLRIGSGAGLERVRMRAARLLGAGAGGLGFGAEARDFLALGGQMLPDARGFAAGLVALMRGSHERLLRFHVLR